MKSWTLLLLPLVACAGTFTPAETEPPDPVMEMAEYDRSDWKHWTDSDGDCQDTRQEVLIEESEVPVTYEDDRQCRVATGKWTCPYTGRVFTEPGLLDIDHVVSLKDAHDSGGGVWDAASKKAFANDLDNPAHLRAVYRSANRSKGSRGPDEWLPENEKFRCTYVQEWVDIKSRYDLSMAEVETKLSRYILAVCDSGQTPPLTQDL